MVAGETENRKKKLELKIELKLEKKTKWTGSNTFGLVLVSVPQIKRFVNNRILIIKLNFMLNSICV